MRPHRQPPTDLRPRSSHPATEPTSVRDPATLAEELAELATFYRLTMLQALATAGQAAAAVVGAGEWRAEVLRQLKERQNPPAPSRRRDENELDEGKAL